MKIAMLYICTGKYDIFWKDFFISCEKYFHPECQKEYFVFTDSNELYQEHENERIHKIFQENLGWPYNTLMRFHMFLKIEKELQEFDYIFFMNANVEFLKEVSFLPTKEQLIVVNHPGFYNKNPQDFTYDRNEKSLAYIPFEQDEEKENLFYGKIKGKYYVFGAFNGGGGLSIFRTH
ncbi:hypothetical protein GW575_03205 [Campylobacter sp. MIT 19-121]|uniref:hypothetical protein n=1 Tax=Campylobacter sp. MIT 19-121 TaxID=2703906 RepID=UPI00138A3864|nr:hypothetical protein [Campylobacter sp. MIT 19-121]NDJ26967.1 hypothetical protein [Campylobacter sp. MIT 19-121]